jgi:hypothetical protein
MERRLVEEGMLAKATIDRRTAELASNEEDEGYARHAH